MARKPIIGHITCPNGCGDMDVREDRNGHPAAWCPECNQQLLTHGGKRAELLRQRMRPVTAPAQPAPKAEPKPETAKDSPPAPAERGLLDRLWNGD